MDEYPNDGNNVRAAHYIDPVPLRRSGHQQRRRAGPGRPWLQYRGSLPGHQPRQPKPTRGSCGTQRVDRHDRLARDKRRPGAHKGDILLGSFTHVGNLGVGENYLGTVQVAIPENVRSGEYFVTVWSDTYDVILEDTLAANINPDDAAQVDNNNYKARPISVLGISPPDLAVGEVTGGDCGSRRQLQLQLPCRIAATSIQVPGSDSVYLTDDPDFLPPTRFGTWAITPRPAAWGTEALPVTQTIQLAPTVRDVT